MAFTTVTVSQNFDLADESEPDGIFTFTPTAPLFNGGVVVPAAPVSRHLDSHGTVSIPLVANTDANTTPADSAYEVTEVINQIARSYTIRVPHDQGAALSLYALVV